MRASANRPVPGPSTAKARVCDVRCFLRFRLRSGSLSLTPSFGLFAEHFSTLDAGPQQPIQRREHANRGPCQEEWFCEMNDCSEMHWSSLRSTAGTQRLARIIGKFCLPGNDENVFAKSAISGNNGWEASLAGAAQQKHVGSARVGIRNDNSSEAWLVDGRLKNHSNRTFLACRQHRRAGVLLSEINA